MMKYEVGGKIITEFIGLRPKLYSYKMHEGKEEKKCKGVKKNVVKKMTKHQYFKRCLLTGNPQMNKMNGI